MKDDWCNIKVSIPYRGGVVYQDICRWLDDNVGLADYDFKGLDNHDSDLRVYYFAFEKDAMMFSLRWS